MGLLLYARKYRYIYVRRYFFLRKSMVYVAVDVGKKNSVKVKTHILAEGNTHNIFHFENINFRYAICTTYSTLKI